MKKNRCDRVRDRNPILTGLKHCRLAVLQGPDPSKAIIQRTTMQLFLVV